MKLFTIVFGAALAISSALSAQNFNDRINVNFPNPVAVNGVTLPAGHATIQVVHNAGTLMLIVRSESGEHSAALASRVNSIDAGNRDASVILDQKDGAYRLNRVLLPDNTALQVLDAQ
jgi:hypothetical protein